MTCFLESQQLCSNERSALAEREGAYKNRLLKMESNFADCVVSKVCFGLLAYYDKVQHGLVGVVLLNCIVWAMMFYS